MSIPHSAFRTCLAMDIRNIANVPAFTTKDGSEIRELLARRNSCIRNQSLAEARVLPGTSTAPHYHPRTEEIYYILAGTGRMTIDGQSEDVGPGDAIAIPPGSIHTITATSSEPLKFLCCCAPGYEHSDTVLVYPRQRLRWCARRSYNDPVTPGLGDFSCAL